VANLHSMTARDGRQDKGWEDGRKAQTNAGSGERRTGVRTLSKK